MGCIHTKANSTDALPTVFSVYNVDAARQPLNPGKIEVTDTDLIFYQKGKSTVKWPVRCLRRYGFDAELFSFESGRRCPTGPGIYAFKCRRAGELFNLLQQCVQNSGGVSSEVAGTQVGHPNATAEITFGFNETQHLHMSTDDVEERNGQGIIYVNDIVIQQQQVNQSRVHSSSNGPPAPPGQLIDLHDYVNSSVNNEANHQLSPSGSSSASPINNAVEREISYAVLDLADQGTNEPVGRGIEAEDLLCGPESRKQSACSTHSSHAGGDNSEHQYINVPSPTSHTAMLLPENSQECQNYTDMADTGSDNMIPGRSEVWAEFESDAKHQTQLQYATLDLGADAELQSHSVASADTYLPKTVTESHKQDLAVGEKPVILHSAVTQEAGSRSSECGTYAVIDFNKTLALSDVKTRRANHDL